MFKGIYHGKAVHQDDLSGVVDRAVNVGCKKLMVTGSDLDESRHAVALAQEYRTYKYIWGFFLVLWFDEIS